MKHHVHNIRAWARPVWYDTGIGLRAGHARAVQDITLRCARVMANAGEELAA